jgi:hypothetical protein
MNPESPDAPFFSVVITTYNRSDILMRALRSVLDQDFPSYEVVVADDGSTDDTPAVLADCTDPRLRTVRIANGGISASKNAGGKAARGRYLVFLDDDDEALPGWLARFAQLIEETDCAIAWCGGSIKSPGAPTATVLPAPLGACFDDFRGIQLVGTFALDREVFLSVGGFREGLAASTLSEFFLRLLPYCTAQGLRVADRPDVGALIHQESAAQRTARSPKKLADSLSTIIELHRERLERSPDFFANCCAVAGVNLARMGQFSDGRRMFTMAIRARPRSWKNGARLLLTLAPPVAARVWNTRAYHDAMAKGRSPAPPVEQAGG